VSSTASSQSVAGPLDAWRERARLAYGRGTSPLTRFRRLTHR
jgi:hypothetical protein